MKLTKATIAGLVFLSTTMALPSCGGQPDGEGDDHATQNENLDMDNDDTNTTMPQDTSMTSTGDTTATM